jgi:hypothetical protein
MQGYNLTNPQQRTSLRGTEEGLRNWCKVTSMDFCGAFAYGGTPTEFWVNGRCYASRRAASTAVASQLAVEARHP